MIAGVGHGPGGASPDDYDYLACPVCYLIECECHHPPPDPTYEEYLEVWHSGAFDDEDAIDAAIEQEDLLYAGFLGDDPAAWWFDYWPSMGRRAA